MTTGTEPTLSTNPIDRGELWSFLRSCLSQGGDIWLDHKEKSYEEYSIRLDAAARERVSKAMHLLGDEITQLRGNLSLAEEGLANYALEVERKNSLIDLQDEAQTSLHAENVRLRVEIEQHKRNLAWQSKEIDAQVQEIQRQQKLYEQAEARYQAEANRRVASACAENLR
jgi:predicted  nucleic acid-binding Zn-ribbon protein